jgi:hypothetical protein
MTNKSWRVVSVVLLSLVVLAAVAFVAYRIGLQQGAGVLTSARPMPPAFFGERGGWFGQRMHFTDGRGFHPMMSFGWSIFHPGFLLGLGALILFVFLLVKAFTAPPPSSARSSSPRSTRK